MPSDRHEKPGTSTATKGLRDVLPKLATEILHLDPGSAAALRRGPLEDAGAAAFWRLLAKHDPPGAERKWAALVQAIAILTPKGRESSRRPAHDSSLRMGEALQKAGVSELRLARLLGAPPDMRPELIVRTCRRLAATEFNRFNLVTLGQFLLFGDDKRPARWIARDYYRAAFAAMRTSKDKEPSTDA